MILELLAVIIVGVGGIRCVGSGIGQSDLCLLCVQAVVPCGQCGGSAGNHQHIGGPAHGKCVQHPRGKVLRRDLICDKLLTGGFLRVRKGKPHGEQGLSAVRGDAVSQHVEEHIAKIIGTCCDAVQHDCAGHRQTALSGKQRCLGDTAPAGEHGFQELILRDDGSAENTSGNVQQTVLKNSDIVLTELVKPGIYQILTQAVRSFGRSKGEIGPVGAAGVYANGRCVFHNILLMSAGSAPAERFRLLVVIFWVQCSHLPQPLQVPLVIHSGWRMSFKKKSGSRWGVFVSSTG